MYNSPLSHPESVYQSIIFGNNYSNHSGRLEPGAAVTGTKFMSQNHLGKKPPFFPRLYC